MNTGLSDSSVDSSQTLDKATLTVVPFPVAHPLRMSMGRDIPTPAPRGVWRESHASAGTPSRVQESRNDSEEIDISSSLENSRSDFSVREEVVEDGEIEEDVRIDD